MLSSLFGKEFTESLIKEVLFTTWKSYNL
jgi:hypothetical protein